MVMHGAPSRSRLREKLQHNNRTHGLGLENGETRPRLRKTEDEEACLGRGLWNRWAELFVGQQNAGQMGGVILVYSGKRKAQPPLQSSDL